MKFLKTSNLYSLNKFTYVNLRWIAYIGQISAILIVQFLFEYKFNYFVCISIIFFSILTNLYLQFKIKDNQLNNSTSTMYLSYDIFQLGILLFFTGGITNPFVFLILVPADKANEYYLIETMFNAIHMIHIHKIVKFMNTGKIFKIIKIHTLHHCTILYFEEYD